MEKLREGILQGNRIRTFFQNNGEIAHWPYSPSFEWPKGSTVNHLDGMTFLVASEVKLPDGQVIHPLQTGYREWFDKDPLTSERWGFEPVPGYSDSSSNYPAIASSPRTWPEKWPEALGVSKEDSSKWYGFYGMKVIPGLEEAFYVMDDSRDKEWTRSPYNFYPVASDPDRGGLGLRVEVRALQSSNYSLRDIIFWHYDLISIADSSYPKTYTGFLTDVGNGGSDSGGDNVVYDQNKDLIYSWDSVGKLPNGKAIGYSGYAFLEPSNPGLTALSIYIAGDGGVGGGWPKDDESMWNKMSSAKYDTLLQNTNPKVVFSSGPFNMEPGKRIRTSIALIMGNDKNDILSKKDTVQLVHDSNYQFIIMNSTSVEESKNTGISKNYCLLQNYPNPFNPSTDISFIIPESRHVKLSVYDLLGKEITVLVNEYKTAGNHTVRFDASSLPSGMYIYSLEAGEFRDSRKLVLVK